MKVLPVADRHDDVRVRDRRRAACRRACAPRCTTRATESSGRASRRAKTEKVPYVLVVGDDDVEARTVGVNRRGSDDPERGVPLDAFLAELDAELAPHR